MPKVFTKKARTDIYYFGSKVVDETTKSGFRVDMSQPANEHDRILILKGSTYYSWSFRYGGTHRSLTYPKPSQLTQSDFLQRVYSWQEDSIIDYEEGFTTYDDVESAKQERISEVEELRDETQEKLDNLPEQFTYAPVGELLQERIDALEEYLNELESANLDEEDIEGSCNDLNNISINL